MNKKIGDNMGKRENVSAINSVAVLTICNLLSRLLGFLRDMVMSYKYGTSDVSDVYYLATNVVTVIFFAISAAISTTYLPIYAKAASDDEDDAKQFHDILFTISLLISTIFSIVIFIFGKQVTYIFAGSFEYEKFELTTRFIKIMSLSMFFSCLSGLIGSFLQYRNRFIFAGISGSILNIGYIIGALLSDMYGQMTLAYSFLFIHIIVSMMLYAYSKKYGLSVNFTLDDKSGYMKQAWVLILPIIFGNIAGQFSEAIDKSMAAGLDTGSVSALNYANKLQVFSIGVFVASIVTVSFPKMSKEYSAGNMETTKNHLQNIILLILALSIPIMFGLIILAPDLVTLVFGRGEFNERSAMLTSGALVIYSIGLPSTALREFFMRALFAMEDTKRPIVVDILGLGLNVALNYIFIGSLKHLGLALGSSLANIAKSILLFYLICKKIRSVWNKTFWREVLKIVMSAVVMLGVVVMVNGMLKGVWYTGMFQLGVRLVVIVVMAAGSYAGMLYVMGNELFLGVLDWLMGMLNGIFGRE